MAVSQPGFGSGRGGGAQCVANHTRPDAAISAANPTSARGQRRFPSPGSPRRPGHPLPWGARRPPFSFSPLPELPEGPEGAGGEGGRRCHNRTARACVALQALEIGPNLGCILAAQIAILFECLGDDAFQLRRKVWIETDGRAAGWVRIWVMMTPVVDPSNACRPVAIS